MGSFQLQIRFKYYEWRCDSATKAIAINLASSFFSFCICLEIQQIKMVFIFKRARYFLAFKVIFQRVQYLETEYKHLSSKRENCENSIESRFHHLNTIGSKRYEYSFISPHINEVYHLRVALILSYLISLLNVKISIAIYV